MLLSEEGHPATLYGVLAREAGATNSPTDWYLLSDYPVDNLEKAQTLIRYYSYRWCLTCIVAPSAEGAVGKSNYST